MLTFIMVPNFITVNGERFTGLNFHGFRGFEEDRKSFFVNILHEL